MAGELKGNRYEVERELGRGGMGVVYLARDTRLPRRVALKMLPPEAMHDAEFRRRLEQEARAASALTHPGVATVYDFEEHGQESFIVFEYVEGVPLRERIARQRGAPEDVLEIGIQLADAVAAAHARGITHRDLKPENIMLTPGLERAGHVKVLDFGLAKLHEPLTPAGGASLTSAETAGIGTVAGLIVGTVNYMSPEQVEGESADARSDIYSLGLVLYEMAAGVNPFVGKTATSTIANILKQEPPALAERNPAAPAELDRILRKCLRKRREERYQSARELVVDLSNLRRDLASPQAQAPGPAKARGDAPFAASRQVARALFVAIQIGYLAMYGTAMFFLEDFLTRLHSLREPPNVDIIVFLAMICALPARLYLLTAVAFDYPDLGRKYRRMFPVVIFLDIVWAFAPLALAHRLGGMTFVAIAGLVYLAFPQRWLVYNAYSRTGGRTSAVGNAPAS